MKGRSAKKRPNMNMLCHQDDSLVEEEVLGYLAVNLSVLSGNVPWADLSDEDGSSDKEELCDVDGGAGDAQAMDDLDALTAWILSDATEDVDNFLLPLSIGCSFLPQVSRTHPRVRHASLQTGFASGAYLPPKARALEPCLPRPRQLLPQTFDITKRRIIKYVQSEHSDGCLHGSYLHALECCQRFNR